MSIAVIYTKLIAISFVLLIADAVAFIWMIISDAIWLAVIPAIVSILTLIATIALTLLTRKTHDLVNSQSERERDQAKQLAQVLSELAELRGKTSGIQTGLAAGKVTAEEKTEAFEKGMGMVQTLPPGHAESSSPTSDHTALKDAAAHLESATSNIEAVGRNTEASRENTQANKENTAALDASKPKP